MTRYRIIQHPSFLDPSQPLYEVQQRVWFWWDHAGVFDRLHDAETRVRQLQAAEHTSIKREVIREYD